jgi:hypothetical protein
MDSKNRTRVIVELVSAGAVLLGLIFVGLELRQNQQMMHSQIRNDLSVGLNDVLLALASNENLASAAARFENSEELTPTELEQIWTWENAIFRYWENVHYQYRNDLYDEIEFTAQQSAWNQSLTKSRAHQYHWCGWRQNYSPEFRVLMDGFLPNGVCDEFRASGLIE